VHSTQISAQMGGIITIVIGALLGLVAFLWARYSVQLQRRAARIMNRPRGSSTEIHAAHKFARNFGTIFIALMGALCFLFGLVELITHLTFSVRAGTLDRLAGISIRDVSAVSAVTEDGDGTNSVSLFRARARGLGARQCTEPFSS
jgi:hypothetical protein